jgi:hypothetical protein
MEVGMSDLQDIIARNSVVSFNSGMRAGSHQERDRIFRILDELAMNDPEHAGGDYAYISDIKEYIQDEDNK